MPFICSALTVFLLLTALFCLGLGVAALRQPPTHFARYYAGLMLAATAYAAGYGLELAAPDPATMRWMLRIEYLGIPFIPLCWIGLSYAYLEPGGLPPRHRRLLLAVSLAMLAVVQTNDLHHLYYARLDYLRVSGLAIARSVKGPLYWVNIAYLDLGAALGVLLLFRAWRLAIPLYRRQALMLLGGSLLPWAFHLIYQLGGAPLGIDLTPFGIAATGATFAIATLRHRVLSVLPLARDLVLDGIAEGVVVLDSRGRIVDFNRAARELLPGLDLASIGTDGTGLARGGDGAAAPVLREVGGRQLEMRVNALQDRHGREIGTVLLIQDVSEKLALIGELRQLATIDSLTGCFNRRHLFELCRHEVRVAQRYRRPLSLIILDLDNFKSVNDNGGHPAGDRLLNRVAATLRSRLRDTDMLGRYGGDEFIVLLPETPGPAALDIAVGLGTLCAGQCGVGLSLGVAELGAGGDQDDLLARADGALYQAKHAGKGRAVLAAAAMPDPGAH